MKSQKKIAFLLLINSLFFQVQASAKKSPKHIDLLSQVKEPWINFSGNTVKKISMAAGGAVTVISEAALFAMFSSIITVLPAVALGCAAYFAIFKECYYNTSEGLCEKARIKLDCFEALCLADEATNWQSEREILRLVKLRFGGELKDLREYLRQRMRDLDGARMALHVAAKKSTSEQQDEIVKELLKRLRVYQYDTETKFEQVCSL